MSTFQSFCDIAILCYQKGIREVVISPGSRSAPLTLAFSKHPDLKCKIISDERSAAFIALGMAQASAKPVVLICTSGTALLNYAPAITEAFYQNVPLLILSADRPPEWIDQQDGQTIHQRDAFVPHVIYSKELPIIHTQEEKWLSQRLINEAINAAVHQEGPAHLNVPIREPFYPDKEESYAFDHTVKIVQEHPSEKKLSKSQYQFIQQHLSGTNKILIVSGQGRYSDEFLTTIAHFQQLTQCVIVSDMIGNLHSLHGVIYTHDLIFLDPDQKVLQADILITFGLSVLSKPLKKHLRKYPPKMHWHLQEHGSVADTFQSLSDIFRIKAIDFFRNTIPVPKQDQDYAKNWEDQQKKEIQKLHAFIEDIPFCELWVVAQVIKNLPEQSELHLANSLSVRYANYFKPGKKIKVYSNRGTSGIDGCVSTAVGHALSTKQTVTLITGDMAFFYDRNAWWHNYQCPNLRIILLNNHGGGIFDVIDGPKQHREHEDYFLTKQNSKAENLAKEYQLDYTLIKNKDNFGLILKEFYEASNQAKIIEIETSISDNTLILKKLKSR